MKRMKMSQWPIQVISYGSGREKTEEREDLPSFTSIRTIDTEGVYPWAKGISYLLSHLTATSTTTRVSTTTLEFKYFVSESQFSEGEKNK